jgi:hypothetical protein
VGNRAADFPLGGVASGVVEMHQITPARDGLESGFVFLPQQFATVSTPLCGKSQNGDFMEFGRRWGHPGVKGLP